MDNMNFRGTPKFGVADTINNQITDVVTINADIAAGHTTDIISSDIGDINFPHLSIELQEILFDDEEKIPYKYAEDRIISDFKAYIDKTYSEHYKTEQQNIECFDAWIALDDATPTFRNTALKYLWRYGKKNGSNKKDLMKALHYTLMCLYNDHYKDEK